MLCPDSEMCSLSLVPRTVGQQFLKSTRKFQSEGRSRRAAGSSDSMRSVTHRNECAPDRLVPHRNPMPRYFFHVKNHINTQDFEGVVLPSLEAAKEEAEKDIVDIKQSHFNVLSGDWVKWSIEICDHQGALLLVVPFSSS